MLRASTTTRRILGLVAVLGFVGTTLAACGGGGSSHAASTPLAATNAAPGQLGTAIEIPYLDLVKAGLQSLAASANSYQCYQDPKASGCDMGGIGDYFRLFGSTEQKQQVQILQQLALINQKLDDIKRTTDEIRTVVERTEFADRLKDLDPLGILQTLRDFVGIAKDCPPGTPLPYKAGSVCELWLGTGPPNQFYKSRLGQEMHAVANRPLDGILQAARGLPGVGGGALDTLPNVVSNKAKEKFFFTASDSNVVQAYYSYILNAELAYMTIYTNYWASEPPISSIDRTAEKNRFIKDLQDNQMGEKQAGLFKPLPAGTTVDMRTGLMWSTNNKCLGNSLQSPATCGISEIAGFPLTATCPSSSKCQVPHPLGTSSPDAGDATLKKAADTSPQSSWKVPTPDQVRALLNDRGSSTGGQFLKKAALIDTNSEYYWTSTMWCPRYVQQPGRRYVCADTVGIRYDPARAPLRVSIKITNLDTIDNKANACNDGPCTAGFFFVRQPPAADLQPYGIQKRWP